MVAIGASLLFLGTGSGVTVGKGLRSSGGFILTLGDNQFHIDPGVGAVVKAAEYGVNLRMTTAVMISHSHLHHANDANAVIDAMSYSGFDRKGVLIANKTAITGTDEYPPAVSAHYREYLERFITVDRGQRIGINEIEIEALTARHSDPNSLGFKFIAHDLTITYSGDTVHAVDIVEQYLNSHILILNVPSIKKQGANLCIEDAVEIINKVKPQVAILTHFGHDLLKADPLYEIREVQKRTGVQTIAAKDGMAINPTSYSR